MDESEKLNLLVVRLKPIPFVPEKILHFARYENILTKLGLWNFVNMDLDREIRVDLMAQLVASYRAGSGSAYVNGCRVLVDKTYLGRSLQLPLSKRKVGLGLGRERYSEEEMEFIVELVLEWLVLHRDGDWVMPNEVVEWLGMVKEGRPEKVDWAGLIWLMVEKELGQREELRECYYASHLQHLMKWQHEQLFVKKESLLVAVGAVECEMGAGVKGDDDHGVNSGGEEQEGCIVGIWGGLKSEQGGQKEALEGAGIMRNDANYGEEGNEKELCCLSREIMGAGGLFEDKEIVECNVGGDGDDDCAIEGGSEMKEGCVVGSVSQRLESVQVDGKKALEYAEIREIDLNYGEGGNEKEEEQCLLSREITGASDFEDKEIVHEEIMEWDDVDKDEEEEAGDGFGAFLNDGELEGDPPSVKLIETMEVSNALGSHSQLHDSSPTYHTSDDTEDIAPAPFRSHSAAIKKDVDFSNKRLRIDDNPWGGNIRIYFEQIRNTAERAKMIHEEKEKEEKIVKQLDLLDKLQQRDAVMEHLRATTVQELRLRNFKILRLERELSLMGSVLDGYKKNLKETQRQFHEYRHKKLTGVEAKTKE